MLIGSRGGPRRRFLDVVRLTRIHPENPDRRTLDRVAALLDAARAVDEPFEPSITVADVLGEVRHGWEANPPRVALAEDAGRAVGVLRLDLPTWENRHLAELSVRIDPDLRRRGLGRRLYGTALDLVAAEGRSTVQAGSSTAAGAAFCTAMGMKQASEEVIRRQHLAEIDWPRLDREAVPADGYELLRFGSHVPDELLAPIAGIVGAINDAPTDDLDVEDEVHSPERVRAFEDSMAARDQRWRRVVARETATGELAGHTMVGVDATRPGIGWQGDTSVMRAHRGHRLGLLLKVDMLRWLRTEEPQLRTIDTGNAGSNRFMIRINELLGYRVLATHAIWQARC
jgi:GNAT superfamily N-acetyltransferase